jgi:hypothetical protein
MHAPEVTDAVEELEVDLNSDAYDCEHLDTLVSYGRQTGAKESRKTGCIRLRKMVHLRFQYFCGCHAFSFTEVTATRQIVQFT